MTEAKLNGENRENGELYLENELLAPYTHIQQVRGKQLRVKIAMAFNHWLQISEENLNNVLDTVHALHTSSLLIDDIQDNSNIRRGLPAAHCVYGLPLTINTALHVNNLAMERAFKMDVKAAKILSEHFLEVCRGQGIDIYWRDNFLCPTEDQYKKMVEQKTGGMFLMAVRMMQLFSENKTEYSELVLLLGRYFQIRDDYCNLSQQEALEEWPGIEDTLISKNNCFCEDITEGKYSLPIIHAITHTRYSGAIHNILRQRTRDVELKKYCVSLLEKGGSLEYTRATLAQLDQDARAEVARLGGNPMMNAVLDELLSWQNN